MVGGKHPTKLGNSCGVVLLGIVGIRYLLYTQVPIVLVLGNTMVQMCEDGFVMVLGLFVFCEWHAVIVRCVTRRNVHNGSKKLLRNCGLSSVIGKAGVLYGTPRWFRKMNATGSAVVFYTRIDQAGFLYRSLMTKMSWFPVVIFGSGRKMSIATSSRVLIEGIVSNSAPS